MSSEKTSQDEVAEVSAQELTDAEVQFTEQALDASPPSVALLRCPKEGQPMARVRCEFCKRWKFSKVVCRCQGAPTREFHLDVDGTLGSSRERAEGGLKHALISDAGTMSVDERELGIRRGWVHLGEPYTAIPKGTRG